MMFHLFGKQYKRLIGHLIFIWLIIIISSVAILGVYYGEDKIEERVNQSLSQSTLIMYFTPNIDTEKIITELMKYNIIRKFNLTTGLESVAKLQKEFDLKNLQKWVSTKNLSDFVTLSIDGDNFSLNNFQELIDKYSNDKRVEDIDYNESEINRLWKVKSILQKYKYYPMLIILLIATIQLFLLRRLIRNLQKDKWQLWIQSGYKHLYKIPHLLTELIILFLIIILTIGIPIYFWQDKIYQLFDIQILKLNFGWYGVFCLLGVYIFICFLNLISKDKTKI